MDFFRATSVGVNFYMSYDGIKVHREFFFHPCYYFFFWLGEETHTRSANMVLTEEEKRVLDQLYELWDRSEQEFFVMEERKIIDEPQLTEVQHDLVRRKRMVWQVGEHLTEWPEFFARDTLPTLSTDTIWELLNFFLLEHYERTHADIDRLKLEDTWMQRLFWENKLDEYFEARPEWKNRCDLHHCFGNMALKLQIFVMCHVSAFVQ